MSETGHTTRLSLGLSNSVREHSTRWTSTLFRPQRIHVSWDASCSQMFPNKSFSTVPVKTLCSVSDAWKMNTRYWKDYDNQWKLYTEENNYWCLHAKYIITMSKTFWGGNKWGKSKLFCGRQEPTGSRSEQIWWWTDCDWWGNHKLKQAWSLQRVKGFHKHWGTLGLDRLKPCRKELSVTVCDREAEDRLRICTMRAMPIG